MAAHPLDPRSNEAGGRFAEVAGIRVATDFGDPALEYQAALTGAGLHDARLRGLIQVTGRDRAAWLNNLVTNVIKTLQRGEDNYAFATSGKGRILFDLNMLVHWPGASPASASRLRWAQSSAWDTSKRRTLRPVRSSRWMLPRPSRPRLCHSPSGRTGHGNVERFLGRSLPCGTRSKHVGRG